MLRGKCCMPYQPSRTRHNTRPNWVGPTSLIMEITPSLGSPDLEYLREQNYSDLRELECDLARNELRSPWPWIAQRIRNRDKRIMNNIRSCQEKKTYSNTQHHVSTQCQKSSDPSLGCDNTTNDQSRRRSSIAGEIIIKEGGTRKVSPKALSFKQKKRGRERGLLGEDL